jgi:diaminohydroxyphosphoribosylaminopyrimidine deaminase/5-amino-6-(5-phosphoribosylamino)uracil reductase
MRRALELARRGWGRTHPNPMVGALIVEDGKIASEGFHAVDGGPHAERVALSRLGRPPAPGATLYVTLEPCSTAGRTGACTEAIIASGLKRVVVGATDPFPAHAGHGFAVLRAAGVAVAAGVLEEECRDLNLIFNHAAVERRPLIAAKWAATLDGRIATRSGRSQWITGKEARADAHRWRRLFPAIAVGAGTLLADDPRLTARIEGEPEWSPVRFVFDGRLRAFAERENANVFSDPFAGRTIVIASAGADPSRARLLEERGIKVWTLDAENASAGYADFKCRCFAAGITGVLVEGGARTLSSMVAQRQVDYAFLYQGALFFADERARAALTGLRTENLSDALRLAEVRHSVLGEDLLTRGFLRYPGLMSVDETQFDLSETASRA